MKKSNIFAIVMSVFILASCASSSDVVDGGLFQKRKYNKGWNFNKKTKIDTKTNKTDELTFIDLVIDEKESVNDKAVNSPSSISSKELVNVPSNNNLVADLSDKKNSNSSSQEVVVRKKESPKYVRNEMKRSVSKSLSFQLPGNNTSDNNETTDGSVVLLVILAILLPFLAVGLYEGITNRFWISVLLWLFFILPGIIYALLIVLGVI